MTGGAPPAHGRLIETLTPDFLASNAATLVSYGVADYTPDRITYNDPPAPGATTGAAVPLVAVRDGARHTFRMALHVRTPGPGPVEYQFYRPGWKPQARATVPAGDATVWFTDAVEGSGWWHWAVTSAGNEWVLRSIDVYEVTDTGPAPAEAPVAHPESGPPAPPLFARIDLRRIRTANSTLGFEHVYGISPGWPGASFRPDLYPATLRQNAVLSLRAPHPRAFRLVCAVRTSAEGRYELDGQVVAAPAGDATVEFTVTATQAGWRAWRLTQTNRTAWLFKSCDVY